MHIQADTSNEFTDLYEVGEAISQQTYVHAQAYKCVEKESGEHRQVLRFGDNRLSEQNESRNLLYDCVVLQQLEHANVVKTYGFFEKDVNDNAKHYWIVMEALENGGPLLEQIETIGGLKESDVATIIETILKVLKYVHEKGHAHGDLRPQNIWVPSTAPDATKSIFTGLKLSGFSPDQSDNKTLRFGSADFLAPEAGDVPAAQVEPRHRQKHDMWAVGMLAYLLLSGKMAVTDKSDKQVREIVKKGEYTLDIDGIEAVSAQAKDFLKSVLDPVPEMRLSPAIALDHAWILEQS